MDLLDNNILITAFRREAEHHRVAKEWLEDALNHGHPLRLFPTVEAGFLRVVTHPKIYETPSPLAEAVNFLQTLCSATCVEIVPWTPAGRERWVSLCGELGVCGNDGNDAMLAAVGLERGLRLVTFDRGFKRFPRLRLLILAD